MVNRNVLREINEKKSVSVAKKEKVNYIALSPKPVVKITR